MDRLNTITFIILAAAHVIAIIALVKCLVNG